MTLLFLLAQPVTDLGVMTPNRVVMLERDTNRSDFMSFTVELQALRWPSNYAKFKTTNDVLKLDDFMAMPPGPCVMGVKSTCVDSEESAIALFRLDIRRDSPVAPKARVISTGTPPYRHSLSNAFRTRREGAAVPPPSPGQTNEPAGSPIPNGKPETYSDGVLKMQDAMQRLYAERRRGR